MIDTYTACSIVEGFGEPSDDLLEQYDGDLEAIHAACWQSLIDSGVCWQLQGWYGRTAAYLIDIGTCTRKAA